MSDVTPSEAEVLELLKRSDVVPTGPYTKSELQTYVGLAIAAMEMQFGAAHLDGDERAMADRTLGGFGVILKLLNGLP